jgi:hypothetical protein
MRFTVKIGVALACAMTASWSVAGPSDDAFNAGNAVACSALDGYRGGFVTDTGMTVTLGLERLVSVNGNLVDQSMVNLGDLGKLTSGQAQLTPDQLGQIRLIQNGGGSTFAGNMGAGALGATVIQNTLNNQIIQNQTVINASVEARGMLQSMNFQSTLSNALNSAATGR